MNYDMSTQVAYKSLLPATEQTATADGAAVSISDVGGRVVVNFDIEAGGGTTPTYDAKIQESADGSTDWQDVSGAAITQVTDAADSVQQISFLEEETRGYVRVAETLTGTSPTFVRSATLIGRKTVES